MLKIRKTKTGSGNIAVQVVKREDQKTIAVKHIGTSNSKNDIHRLQKDIRMLYKDMGIM